MATRLSLAEQIQIEYARATGNDGTLKSSIDKRIIYPLINQVANELLMASIQVAIKMGDISVPSSVIATYSNIAVNTENGRYFALLPAYPLMLPRNLGVFSVIPQSGDPLVDGTPLIPITNEDWDLLSTTDINDTGLLEGQVGFQAEGRKIFFTKNPTVSVVKIKLLISDPALIGDSEPYPITPELELALIARVLELLKSNTATNK